MLRFLLPRLHNTQHGYQKAILTLAAASLAALHYVDSMISCLTGKVVAAVRCHESYL